MPKQEEMEKEIKQLEIKKFISLYLRQRFTTDEVPEDECDSEAEFIIKYLHSQGVVIKVDRELPNIQFIKGNQAFVDIVKKAGYVATIPLEENGN